MSWYRGEHCNYNPDKAALEDADAIPEFILKGWLPKKPFISKVIEMRSFAEKEEALAWAGVRTSSS